MFADSYSVSFPPLPRVSVVARKRPRSFSKNCRWQVTSEDAYTFEPTKSEWADYNRCPGIVWDPIRKRAHTQLVREHSSQLAEPLWTDPGLKSGISVHELISTKKKKKGKRRTQEMNRRTFSQNPRTRGKSHHHHQSVQRRRGDNFSQGTPNRGD